MNELKIFIICGLKKVEKSIPLGKHYQVIGFLLL